jgi:SulP family sulfate permease
MLIPQGMAYALLAGLPPVSGLYAATVPLFLYALFGSSRHLAVGPVAIVSLLTFTSVAAFAEPGTDEYLGLALLLALMSGAIQLALGLMRLGVVSNFISRPVISGFTSAAAIVIAVSQLHYLLGIELPRDAATFQTLAEAARSIGEVNATTLAIGVASIAALALLGRFSPRVPAALLVVAGATSVVYFFGLDRRGVSVTGEIPQGLPGLSLPPLNLELFGALLIAALVISLIGFAESLAIGKAIASRTGHEIDPNQELKGLGLANLSAAFFSGYPVAGSFSRTAIQYRAGGETQMASIITAMVIVVVLLFLTPLFYYVPNAALAAIVMVAVYGLINLREAPRLYRIKRADGLSLIVTFAGTLLIGIEEGLLLGALFAILAFLERSAHPAVSELGYIEKKDTFADIRGRFAEEATVYPEVLIVRFEASLYFANATFFKEWLQREVAKRPDLEWVVVSCRSINSIDTTAIEELESLVRDLRLQGIDVLFASIKVSVRDRLIEADWKEKFGGNIDYATAREALGEIGLLDKRASYDQNQ